MSLAVTDVTVSLSLQEGYRTTHIDRRTMQTELNAFPMPPCLMPAYLCLCRLLATAGSGWGWLGWGLVLTGMVCAGTVPRSAFRLGSTQPQPWLGGSGWGLVLGPYPCIHHHIVYRFVYK